MKNIVFPSRTPIYKENVFKTMTNKELKQKTIEFLSGIEGYHETLKGLHWSAKRHSEHVLTDDMDGDVLEYEDKIAECVMGLTNLRIGVGELKSLLPVAKTLDNLVPEMENDVIKFKKEIESNVEYSGLVNIIDEFLSDIAKWNYLKTLV
jgi:hypothetical protein